MVGRTHISKLYLVKNEYGDYTNLYEKRLFQEGTAVRDGHGRTIDYLRISLTDRCNFRCIYCMPEDGVQMMSHDEILRIEEIEQIARVATRIGIRSMRLTGGEPLVRKGVVSLVRSLANMPGIENISMTTNGVLLPRMADDLKEAGLSRVNISLDTLDPDQFRQITRLGSIEGTLAGIERVGCLVPGRFLCRQNKNGAGFPYAVKKIPDVSGIPDR